MNVLRNLFVFVFRFFVFRVVFVCISRRFERKYGESLLVGRRGVSSLMNVSKN